MMIGRRILSLFATFSLLSVLAVGTTVADTTYSPLYKWVDAETEYDENQPVVYSPNGDSTQVEIPDEYVQAKEQFRSSWVGTIFNLHFQKSSNEEDFRAKYAQVLDNFVDSNLNAVIFQVRPEQDAWYPSQEGNPWSKYLTTSGVEGTDPGYDPLQIMVEETHQAGMEYHAWFNPYRVTNRKVSLLPTSDVQALQNVGYSIAEVLGANIADQIRIYNEAGLLSDDNFAVLHPEWVLRHDEKLFLNPGIPEVRQHIVDTINEVAQNYDIDAIHFDDYFYPDGFGSANLDVNTAQDSETFQQYQGDFPSTSSGLEDWRRGNTTALVAQVKASLAEINSAQGTAIQFGISPAGIWDHAANNALGSLTPTTSMSSYRRIYADTYTWVKDELVDYIAPQIYWAFSTAAAPYGELVRWWNNVAEGTQVQVYVGHANYKFVDSSNSGEWSNPEEIANQLRFNQTMNNVYGSAFYSYNDILHSNNDVKNASIEKLKEYFSSPALVPAKPWLSNGEVSAPKAVVDTGDSINWDNTGDGARFFIVYAGEGTPEEIIAKPENIRARLWAGTREEHVYQKITTAQQFESQADQKESYVITAVDAAGVESLPIVAQSEITPTATPQPESSQTDSQKPESSGNTGTKTSENQNHRADSSNSKSALAATGPNLLPLIVLLPSLFIGASLLVWRRRLKN